MMTPAKTRIVTSAALGAAALLGGALLLSACGKLGTLEQAPPLYGDEAKASWSASRNAGGGSTATLEDSNAKPASERALPQADDDNKMEDPYRANRSIQDAPLEGFGNATRFDNDNPNN